LNGKGKPPVSRGPFIKPNQRMVEASKFEIMVGTSNNDIKLQGRIEVIGQNRVLAKVWCGWKARLRWSCCLISREFDFPKTG
jgi:hypothetical protein